MTYEVKFLNYNDSNIITHCVKLEDSLLSEFIKVCVNSTTLKLVSLKLNEDVELQPNNKTYEVQFDEINDKSVQKIVQRMRMTEEELKDYLIYVKNKGYENFIVREL